VELLAEAASLLEGTEARLCAASAHFEYGRALRHAGRRVEAREELRLALDGAVRCGARPLAEAAADELRASGGRLRRVLVSGVEGLTPSERRVAELAASGQTNPQIADALFLSVKTVQMHLGRVYRKLDLTSRDELPAALGD
jgi:DNA-binding CsgD family transcriptional regulator